MNNNRALDPAMAGRLAYPIGKSDPIFSYLLQIGLFFSRIGVKKLRKFKVLKADMLFLSSNIGVLCLLSPFGFFITYLGQDSPALAAPESWGNPSFSNSTDIFALRANDCYIAFWEVLHSTDHHYLGCFCAKKKN